jgi:hypothetical protein
VNQSETKEDHLTDKPKYISTYGWRTREDCEHPGCQIERAYDRTWCRDHDPRRCEAQLDNRPNHRCRNRSKKGESFCRHHAPRRLFGLTKERS